MYPTRDTVVRAYLFPVFDQMADAYYLYVRDKGLHANKWLIQFDWLRARRSVRVRVRARVGYVRLVHSVSTMFANKWIAILE